MSCLTQDGSAHRLSKTNEQTQKHGLKMIVSDKRGYVGRRFRAFTPAVCGRFVAGLSPHMSKFDPTAVRVGLLVGKVEMGQVYLRRFWF
jgi:hypothetical protein